MEIFLRFAISFSLILLLIQPSLASTMPGADRPISRLNLGSAPGLGVDLALDQRTVMGLSLATPFYFASDFGTLRYSAHGMYQVLRQDGFYMALVMGIYGDLYFPDLSRHPILAVQGGAALAYDLNSQLTLRLNIVPGISLQLPPQGWIFFPPAGGVELAWHIHSHLEGSLGFNGNGDILGLSWIF